MSKNIISLIFILILVLSPIMLLHHGVVEVVAEINKASETAEDLTILGSINMTHDNNAYYCDIFGGEITILMSEYLTFNILSNKDVQLNNENNFTIPLNKNNLYNVIYSDNILTINNIQYNYNFPTLKIVFKSFGVVGDVDHTQYTSYHNENYPVLTDINIIHGNVTNVNGVTHLIPIKLTDYENTISNFIAINHKYKLIYISLINMYQKEIAIDIEDNMFTIKGDYDLIEAFNPKGEKIIVKENNILFEINGAHKIRLTKKYCITNLLANVTIPDIIAPEEPDVIVPPDGPDFINPPEGEDSDFDNSSEDKLERFIRNIIHVYAIAIFILIILSFIITIAILPRILVLAKNIKENGEYIEINNSILKENNQISARFINHNKAKTYLLGLLFIALIAFEIIMPILFPLITIFWAYHSSSIIEQMSGRNSKTKNILHNKKLLLSSIVYKTMLIAGTLFFIVPGILIRINFGMYSNIIIDDDNSNETIISIFAKSINLMRGYRIAYFKLLCKQFFYVIISILSFGILLPWTLHYIISQKSLFYLSIYN